MRLRLLSSSGDPGRIYRTVSDSKAPSPPAVRSYGPHGHAGIRGPNCPYSGSTQHLGVWTRLGTKSEMWRLRRMEGQGRMRGKGHRAQRDREGGRRRPDSVCSRVLCCWVQVWATGSEGGTRRPRGGDRCRVTPARLPQLRPHFQSVRPCTSQRRLLRRAVALAIYTLLKIACEMSSQSAQAEFELHQ